MAGKIKAAECTAVLADFAAINDVLGGYGFITGHDNGPFITLLSEV